MSGSPFTFSPEERGFERVTDDDSDALYATDSSRDATGKVEREEFAARGTEDTGFYAQKVQRDESGKIVGKQTFGTKSDTRQEAVESVEAQVRNRTAANFGGFTIGEFNVGRESNIDQARRAHLSRTQEAKIADASKRAPITTDASRYVSQPGELDYPGVDTPTTDPQVLPKDLRQEQRPDTTDPDTQTVSESESAKQSVNAANSANGAFLLEDQIEAGVDDDDLNREVFFSARAEQAADVSASPGELFDFVGSGHLFGERKSDTTRPPEQALEEQQESMGGSQQREQFDFPEWTVSRAGTYLNKKVYSEGREELDDLRERVVSARGQGGSIELSREEYNTFQDVVREGADDELDALEGREANIFGDAEEQRETAREAKQGIINNPPSSLYGGG